MKSASGIQNQQWCCLPHTAEVMEDMVEILLYGIDGQMRRLEAEVELARHILEEAEEAYTKSLRKRCTSSEAIELQQAVINMWRRELEQCQRNLQRTVQRHRIFHD